MKRRRHILYCMDAVWSLSTSAYRRYLKVRASGSDANLDDYGTFLGDTIHVTDSTEEDFLELLRGLKSKPSTTPSQGMR